MSVLQPESWPYGEVHILDPGGGRGFPDAVSVWGEPGPGPEIPQLQDREGSHHVRLHVPHSIHNTTLQCIHMESCGNTMVMVSILTYFNALWFCRSCYMVFPSLQVALALSCVMGLVMFARYCGEDQFHKIGNLSKNEVSRSVWVLLFWSFRVHH